MRECLIIFIACSSFTMFAQDSSLLKKRFFKIRIERFDDKQTKGFLAGITDSSLQITEAEVPFGLQAEGLTTLNYNLLQAVTVKRRNGGLRGLRTGFLSGFAIGGIIGLASGDDQTGFIRFSAGEKALVGGLFTGIIGSIIGAVIGGALPGRHFNIAAKKENFDQLRMNVLDRAYRQQ